MEKTVVLIFLNLFLVPGVIIAIVLLCGRGANLIAGFNTAKPEERARWDQKALCRGVGALLLVMLACLEVVFLGAVRGPLPLMWAGLGVFAAVTALGVLWINRSKRFKK